MRTSSLEIVMVKNKSDVETNTPNQTLTASNCTAAKTIAILVTDGVDIDAVIAFRAVVKNVGMKAIVISLYTKIIKSAQNTFLVADYLLTDEDSLQFDAVFIPGNKETPMLSLEKNILLFLEDAYNKGKIIASTNEGEILIKTALQSLDNAQEIIHHENVINYSENSHQFFKKFIHLIQESSHPETS